MSIAEKFVTMEYGPAPEDPKEALTWLDRHERRFGHFINGTLQPPAEDSYFETADPSTGEMLAAVAQGSAKDVDAAVRAARAALPAWQALTPYAPALATGNTVVLKPAEFTPLTALAFAEICQEIGLPPGVVNIVTGDSSTGEALVRHPDLDKIAFTGSTEVGRAIRAASANSHKKISLELGGKSPFIIFEDADLDSAVEGLVDGIWFNQGQVCCAGSRLLMQESIAEPRIMKVTARMETLRVGAPLDKAIDVGAIVAPVQLERIRRLVDQGIAEGATCHQPAALLPTKGLYFSPTLLVNVHPTSTVAQEEIFGPVLAAMT